ncbi:MAG: D-hexose-6-phosphate mutarotase [Pseudomonadota bacterium]
MRQITGGVMQTIEELKKHFALPGCIDFIKTEGGLIAARVENRAAKAAITLQGAQLIDYRLNDEPVIWLSEEASLKPGKSIRGGAPVCWPWFGAHADDSALPAHGYARTVPWRLLRVDAGNPACTELEFALIDSAKTRSMFPQPLKLRLTLRIGASLELALQTTNSGSKPVRLTEALHTYFAVGDVGKVSLHGLEGCNYLDKVTGFDRKQQHGAVRIDGEVDRIYLDTDGRCEIRDPVLGRRLVLRAKNSRSTVVWNPGSDKARQMGDLGPEGYRRMLCVETANAAENALELQPGQVHTLEVGIAQRAY